MHYLVQASRRAALRLVPLALLAVSAQAAAIFNIVGTDCSTPSVAALAVSGLVANPLPLSGGVQGAVLNGTCSDTVPGTDFILEASMFGDFTGSDMPLPDSVPVAFDFTISVDTLEVLDWYVELLINDASYFTTGGTTSMNPANPAGSGSAFMLPGGVLGAGDTWRAVAGVNCRFCDGLLTIDLGNSSLRVNPAGAPSIPEPSTLSLFALGGVLLWFKRRRLAPRA
jgi:hypothetical protein